MPGPDERPAINPYATPGTTETTAPGDGLLVSMMPAGSVVIPPGHRLVSGIGSARGRVRRFRGLFFATFSGLLGLLGLLGGKGYARWRGDLRRLAFLRMIEQAEGQQAEAVVGVSFQSQETLFGSTLVTCSGVTVRIAPIPGANVPAAPADPAHIERLRADGVLPGESAEPPAIPPFLVTEGEHLLGFHVVAVVGLVQAGAVRWEARGGRGSGALRSGGQNADALDEHGPVAAARARLLDDAARVGANAVIGLRATLHVLAPGISEAVCLGTAVVVAHNEAVPEAPGAGAA